MRAMHVIAIVLSATALFSLGCGDDDDGGLDVRGDADSDIVAVTAASPDLQVLSEALGRAELDDTLAGPGPFTLFAPSDAAFDRLPAGTLDDLADDELGRLLRYHVVIGRLGSEQLPRGPIATMAGYSAFIDEDGDLDINDVDVIEADVEASNGVIHVIDEVLQPPNLVRALELADDFDELLAALDRADLTDTLRDDGPFTVFAPTDEAFDSLPEGTLAALDEQELRDLLLFHVIDARVLSTDLTSGLMETMLDGEQVEVDLSGDDVRIEGARVIAPDIQATNGVIHSIDAVLLP